MFTITRTSRPVRRPQALAAPAVRSCCVLCLLSAALAAGVGCRPTRGACSGSLNEFPIGLDRTPVSRPPRSILLAPRAGLMSAAWKTAPRDGAGSVPATGARMAGCLEVPRPLRLILTVGWNLTQSVGLPVAAYVIAAWLDGRDAGLVAGLAAIWLTAVIRKVATGSVPSLLTISAVVLTVQTAMVLATGELWLFLCSCRSRTCACASCSSGPHAARNRSLRGWPPRWSRYGSQKPITRACTASSRARPGCGREFSCCWRQAWRC